MADKYPYNAYETGTYVTGGSPDPVVNMSGTAVDLGSTIPSRTFKAAADDVSATFASGDTCQVLVAKDSSNWEVYKNVPWTDAATDTLGLGTGTKISGAGTISNSDSVSCYAQVPEDRIPPDPSSSADGAVMVADGTGSWEIVG